MYKIKVEGAITLSKYSLETTKKQENKPSMQELKYLSSKYLGVTYPYIRDEGNGVYSIHDRGTIAPNPLFVGFIEVLED